MTFEELAQKVGDLEDRVLALELAAGEAKPPQQEI